MDKDAKNKYRKQLIKLCTTMLKIGTIGFGGGSALIPVMHKQTAERSQLVSSEEFEKDVMVANITPGALPVEIASGIGNAVCGLPGMLLGAIMMALPGMVGTVLILALLGQTNEKMTEIISYISAIIACYIIVILGRYVVGTVKKCIENQSVISSVGFMLLAFFMTCGKEVYQLFGIDGKPMICVSTIHFLAVAFLIIFVTGGKPNRQKGWFRRVFTRQLLKKLLREEFTWAGFALVFSLPAILLCQETIGFMGKGLLSAIMSFGGGDAYLAVADGLFVNSQMISSEMFYSQVVTVANSLPGSILCKVLSGIGYMIGHHSAGVMGGLLLALSGFACSVAASGGTFSLVACIYDQLDEFTFFRRVKKYIRPIVSGLLMTVSVKLLSQILHTFIL